MGLGSPSRRRPLRSLPAFRDHLRLVVSGCYAGVVFDAANDLGRFNVEHNSQYQSGRYPVVEQIERVKDGFRVSDTAYDDQTAKELPWHPQSIIRFDVRW